MIWKFLFSALGLGSFVWILNGYGFSRLAADLLGLGWWSIPLALSWIPVVFLYAVAWLLITPELRLRHLWMLFRLSVISVAWNNLSPFVKFLGEPVRVLLLERWIGRKASARSMVLYNIVHTLGTLLSFFCGALLILALFPVREALRTGLISLLVAAPLIALALFFLPYLTKSKKRGRRKRSKLVVAGFWMRWSLAQIRIFSRQNPVRFWVAVLLEVAARFSEGLTFWVGFQAIGQPASALASALLDVGRALVDNMFFFIPYQVGSREGGIVLLAEHALGVAATAAVSTAVFYRLVEILWMGIGYVMWIAENKAPRSST